MDSAPRLWGISSDSTEAKNIRSHHSHLGAWQSDLFYHPMRQSKTGLNQLCLPNVSKNIFAATEHYQNQTRWHAHLLLLMPDHLHALISFPRAETMQQIVRAWKHYLSNKHNIEWQRDFFDHRLRSDESHQEELPLFVIILCAPASSKRPATGHMFGRQCHDFAQRRGADGVRALPFFIALPHASRA